MHINICK